MLDVPIVHEDTEERLLTGADLDVESLALATDGSFWIGEEFGPFLLHADADGALLEAPVPLPGGVRSLQSPYLEEGETPSVRASKGFEALAASPNGKILHPILERDDVWGPDAVTKKVYRVDLRRTDADGTLEKTLVIDLLAIPHPDGIGLAADPGAYGVGESFSFPMQSVETVVLLEDGRLLIANDNDDPSNDARYPGTTDDTEMILIDLGTRRRGRA